MEASIKKYLISWDVPFPENLHLKYSLSLESEELRAYKLLMEKLSRYLMFCYWVFILVASLAELGISWPISCLSLFFNSETEHSFVYGLCLLDMLIAHQYTQAAISTKRVTGHDEDYAHFFSETQPRKLASVLLFHFLQPQQFNLSSFVSIFLHDELKYFHHFPAWWIKILIQEHKIHGQTSINYKNNVSLAQWWAGCSSGRKEDNILSTVCTDLDSLMQNA